MRVATDPTTVAGVRGNWTPARWFLLVPAVVHLPLAVGGLVINRSFPGPFSTGDPGAEVVFGVFRTNGWHSLAALLVGAVALWFTLNPKGTRATALTIGLVHVVVVVQFALVDPVTFWIASNNADQGVHAFSALGGILSALLTPRTAHVG